MVGEKKYIYKVFSVSGTTTNFLGVFKDYVGHPSFEVNINHGMGEMTIQLARPWKDFGENFDVKNGNLVKCYVADKDSDDDEAKLIASGYVSGYTPVIAEDQEETILLTVLGNAVRLQDSMMTVSGNTQVNFYTTDPSNMMSTIINSYNTTVSGAVTFGTNIDQTGTSVTYLFNLHTYKQALDKILELAPQRWWYTIDPDDTIQLHPRRWSADHTLVVGKNISSIAPFKNIEDIKNIVYFVGEGIQSVYRNTTSIVQYGEKTHVLEDRRVTLQASADIIANSFLNAHTSPEVRTRLTVIDNNGDSNNRGYDIESFKVGQMVSVIHPNLVYDRTLWNEFQWNDAKWNGPIESVLSTPMQIVKLTYRGTTCDLELSSRAPEISKRLEDINRNLKEYVQATLTT